MKTKPRMIQLDPERLRKLRRDSRNGRIAVRAVLSIIKSMEDQGAIRLPFPGLDDTKKTLNIYLGDA